MSDMAELFARDPLKHTRESIDEIITYYRGARANFILGEKSAGGLFDHIPYHPVNCQRNRTSRRHVVMAPATSKSP